MRTPFLFTAAVLLAWDVAAAAQPGANLVGQRVMPKAGCQVKNGDRLLSDVSLPYRVADVRDGWLDIGPGYVWHDEVLPLAEAADYYTSYLRSNPRSTWAYINRGICKKLLNDGDGAVQDFTEAIRLEPRETDAYLARGNAWAGQGNYERALADFETVMRLSPNDAAAYYRRGLTRFMIVDNEGAIVDLDRAIELRGDRGEYYRSRGLVRCTTMPPP